MEPTISVMAVPKRSDRFFSSGFRINSWRPVEKTFSYVFTNRDTVVMQRFLMVCNWKLVTLLF